MSQIKNLFTPEIETQLNKLINLRQQVSYVFQGIASTFQREEQRHYGTEMFFWRRSDKIRMDARRTMRFVIRCGGRVQIQTIPKPNVPQTMPILEAMTQALHWEQQINKCVTDLVRLCAEHKHFEPIHALHFFLYKQQKLIKKLANNITLLRKNGENLGESLFDEHVLIPLEHRKTIKILRRLPKTVPRVLRQKPERVFSTNYPRMMTPRCSCVMRPNTMF